MIKATGIIRRMDDLGRFCIPKELRRSIKIKETDSLEVFVGDDGAIILKKYKLVDACAICGATEDLFAVTASQCICHKCAAIVAEKNTRMHI